MSIAFTRWPEHLARRYRELGYWQGLPLTAMLDRQCRERGEAIAIVCGERQISYAELDRQATRLASHLLAQGLQQGDTALVQLPNVAEFYVVFFALLKAGIVPVNALYSHQLLELRAYARQIRPALWIADAAHPAQAQFSVELAQISPSPVVRFVLGSGDAHDLAHLLATPATELPLKSTPAEEVAFFQLSGGSTGTPKLIPRTHDDYYYSVRQSNVVCGVSAETRYLCPLPAGHNYPLSSPGALGIFEAGGTVVLTHGPEALHCFELIARHRVTMAALVPSAVLLWLLAAPEHREKLASLQLLQVGGASFAEATARRVPAELGCALQQVFGMAEGLVNYTRLDDDPERVFTTQGCPMSPDDEISIRDENGAEVADGVAGLLYTRGPYTFRGYFESPQHNARVFDAEGFYCSGDVVVRGADGYLRVVGRVKDQINRGGEKIAAEEIENLLREHPSIHDAALVGLPDALLGEKSCAVIVVRDPTLRLPAVRRFLRAQGLADYKLPDRIEHRASLPLTAVGKIDKQALRLQLEN